MRDWKKAFIQGKNYQLGADYVYLAIPLMNCFTLLRKAEYKLTREGIGLLIVNENTGKVTLLLKAKKSTKVLARVTPFKVDERRIQRYSKRFL
jgi:hypothetical protein